MTPFAEVIGDPIAHSLSPAIHRYWLERLGLPGRYEATLVRTQSLSDFLAARCSDPAWRGCNVTAPLKKAVIPLLDAACAVGAVNCIVPDEGRLIGHNTDIDGIAEALTGADLDQVVLIGAGGAARAALAWLDAAGARHVIVLARNPNKAAQELEFKGDISSLNAPNLAGASLIINASPLGMAHADAMPDALLADLAAAAPGATVFDMVYEPLHTALLRAARAADLCTVDGLTMLIGQARRAFRLFFGADPPAEDDARLRSLLIAGTDAV